MRPLSRMYQAESPIRDSVIAAGTTVTGTIRGSGRLVVEGHLQGEASTGSVIVTPTGSIDGEVSADLMQVAGHVTGAAQVGHLRVLSGGIFTGDALYASLEVLEGATLDARCHAMPSVGQVPASVPARPRSLAVRAAGMRPRIAS